jgi:hypothetical protein
MKLFPEEDYFVMTTGSALSLAYDEDPIKHRILAIYEATQLQDKDNSTYALLLRTLISENRIVHRTVVEDPLSLYGRRTETIVKEGPVCVIITTTADSIHAENETRMLRFGVTETADQTAKVMATLGASAEGAQAADDSTAAELEAWHNFQRWIAAGPREVVVPFATVLAELIPPAAVRFRRDFSALLGLIRGHALLYQAQRERNGMGAVVASIDDYAAVRPIIAHVMTESVGKKPSEQEVRVVQLVEAELQMAAVTGKKPDRVAPPSRRSAPGLKDQPYVELSKRQVATKLGVDPSAAFRAINRAVEDGYLRDVSPNNWKGKPKHLSSAIAAHFHSRGGVIPG